MGDWEGSLGEKYTVLWLFCFTGNLTVNNTLIKCKILCKEENKIRVISSFEFYLIHREKIKIEPKQELN